MMDRRRFLLTLVAGALVSPIVVCAQQTGRLYRIGFLYYETARGENFEPFTMAFRNGLRDFGYVEGKNVNLEYRWAGSDSGRFRTAAAGLVASGVDVIVSGGDGVVAAKSVTTTVPIVAIWMLEPTETGVIESLARPGGNVTGLTYEDSRIQVMKKLEIFKQLVPKASRMAAVWDPTLPGLSRYWPPFLAAAKALRMNVYSVEYSRPEDLDRLPATILKDRPSAIFFWGSPLSYTRREALCNFALENRIPTLASSGVWTEAGCLISYAPDVVDLFRRAAVYVDKILKGAKPADLPVEQPTKFEMLINSKTAKALGLTIPQTLLLGADKIIE